MELSILHAIQSIRTPFLDSVMVTVFNTVVGSKGQLWVMIGLVLFVIPKTRKCGLCVLVSYLLSYVLCDGYLKELFARPRPCAVDETVDMIVSKPSSYSFPSVHSAIAFAAAGGIFFHYRRAGIAALVIAALVGFSRMYFFVHYPSDVLVGALIGFLIAWFVYALSKKCFIMPDKT